MADLPAMIGPYQVLKRLGAGGMGEVFLAYDERLDRNVAIKRIRSDVGSTPERRERFRREARVAAKLNHPAIVQIYDVLTEEDASYIVMEHVEGTNLRQLLVDGPLPVEEVVPLARDVAEGLAEAHRQGIVHRDLKSENVLVTPEGRAKIADFGIAKRVLAGTEEGSLTAVGHVLGTYRAMSPEQARGEAVDFRSDLFSLGVLLYEALTGRSPFEAENELAMLNRIVHARQTPVREVRSEVPEELSTLVDQLLEKYPLLRPRSAGEVARVLAGVAATTSAGGEGDGTVAEPFLSRPSLQGPAPPQSSGLPSPDPALTGARRPSHAVLLAAILLLIGAGALSYFALRKPREPLYVAVLRPEVSARTGGASADLGLLASGVRIALMQGLLTLDGLSPKSPDEIDAVGGRPLAIARAVAADEVVASRLQCGTASCSFSLSRVRGQDGSVLWTQSVSIPTDDFSIATGAAASQIRRAYADHAVRDGAFTSEASSQDLKDFLTLRQRFESRQGASLDEILRGLAELRGRAPRFLDAYLLEIEVARFRFYYSRDPEVLKRAFAVAKQARALAPDDPRVLVGLFYAALAGGELATAEQALEQYERLAPGEVGVLELKSGLLLARGRTGEAIDLMRSEVQRRPSWKRLASLGVIEYQHGEIAAGRRHLEESLSRAPGNVDALSALGGLELQSGDPARAVKLYEALVRRSPGIAEVSNLGFAYFLVGRYEAAQVTFRKLMAGEPNNPFIVLNLADTELAMGRTAEAQDLYRRVVELTERDPHAADPQLLTVKAQALAHLGQGLPAVEAVREALRLDADNGPRAFEAAIVYALLGERTSALANAEIALRKGCSPSWFDMPWFNTLRSSAELQGMIAKYSAEDRRRSR